MIKKIVNKYLRTHAKLNKLTRQLPGQSGLGSGIGVVVGWVGGGGGGGGLRCGGGGRGFDTSALLELSQQMCPFLQFEVFVIIIAGRSQNADIILTMHIPGHRGSDGGPLGLCVVTTFSS